MARKRKHRVTHRRRRVGAASGMAGLAMKAGGVAGGVFAGGMIAKTLGTVSTSLSPTIIGALLLGGGIFLAGKSKNPLMEGLGYGLAAKGANNLLTSTGLITGMGSIPLIGYRATPKLQNSVGNVMRNPIGGVKDLSAIGALYDN
jgi:hypothetical protein